MLNFDVVGTGEQIIAAGHEELRELAVRPADALGVPAEAGFIPAGATSDHEPFELAGIPVLILYANDYSRIHSPNDTLEFVQPERLGSAFLLAKTLLQSPDFLR